MQKITQIDIKTYLIHKLGGYTKKEYEIPSMKTYINGHQRGFKLGYSFLAIKLKHLTIQKYGLSKQEWINAIYNVIENAYQNRVQ